MNKREEQVEEQGTLIVEKTDEPIISVDDMISKGEYEKKKRDTSFVDERKKQIELYGNYYPAGLSDQKLLHWIESEGIKLKSFVDNLFILQTETLDKIESDRQAKLAEIWNKLSESEKQQLKSMPV